MTDLEATKLCAEAMGYLPCTDVTGRAAWTKRDGSGCWQFDPLHDDAQAMALVKRFRLVLTHYHVRTPSLGEHIAINEWQAKGGDPYSHATDEAGDLNRAIVMCVAKMQLAKGAK